MRTSRLFSPAAAIRPAFTLVEILIVVVILGILAAISVPQFASATSEASRAQTIDELQSVRRALSVYTLRNSTQNPNVQAGNGMAGAWGELVGPNSGYLLMPPTNNYVGGPNARVIKLGSTADSSFETTHGWIFDPASGNVWAAGFDANDKPYPRP